MCRTVECCHPSCCEPPCPPDPACPPPCPESDPRVSFASYLERQNLEDRVEWSPDALRAADQLQPRPDAPLRTDSSESPKSNPNPGPRLADVLPVAQQVRRVVTEELYRLRLATGRPSGVLDVMA